VWLVVADPDADPAARISILDADGFAAAIPELAALLVDAVDGGASVGFFAGLGEREAADWWRGHIPQIADGSTTLFVAAAPDGGDGESRRIVGSTLLIRSSYPNGRHRAEVAKVLVHRSVRRQGIGRALMEAVERHALADDRWLLILDTQTGSAAEALYRSMGWQELGVMPNHAYQPDGALAATTYFWKGLRSG
jgi:GNAT superfamily N-acetyltransferase